MKDYSVLMSVYYKDNPDYLREAMKSIYDQTLPTNDFVLVCDGPLNDELDSVIEEMQKLFGNILNVYRLKKNSGLGNALNAGLKKCKNELVGRMDSDDICRVDRFEKQVELFNFYSDTSVISAAINEFNISPNCSVGKRIVPSDNNKIIKYSKRRNPFNHPAVMFKKSHVNSVGGYSEEFHLFEDYHLWIRMLMRGYKGYNSPEIFVDMRTPTDIYKRRGGWKYAKNLLRFHFWSFRAGWETGVDFFIFAFLHYLICILPNSLRKLIYTEVLR